MNSNVEEASTLRNSLFLVISREQAIDSGEYLTGNTSSILDVIRIIEMF